MIKPDGNQKEVKTLSLQQLNDLQSRLMLVVGRDERRKSDVDRFVEVKKFLFLMLLFYLFTLYCNITREKQGY